MKFHRAFAQGIDKLVHQRVCRQPNFIGCALRRDAAIGQHNHLVGDPKGLLQIMLHHNAGNTQRVVELADQLRRRTQ